MKIEQSSVNYNLSLWRRDFQFERGYNFFLVMLSTLGINTKPADFIRQVVVSLVTISIVGLGISLYQFYAFTKNLKSSKEFRLERLSRGWKWRIGNNLCVFTVVAIGIGTLEFVVHSLFGTALYSYWQYLLICLLISAVYGIFFTITSALLDLRARNLSNS